MEAVTDRQVLGPVARSRARRRGFARPVRANYVHNAPGCGVVTSMGEALAETYAADPSFYETAYCVRCQAHPPVSEFTWADEDGTDTGIQVGT